MIQKVIFSLFLFILKIQACDDQCLKCEVYEGLQYEKCQQCVSSRVYDEINQQCMKKEQCEYYQQHQYTNMDDSTCVSICKQNTISLISDNSCRETYQCSVQHIQSSNMSQGRDIADIYLQDNYNLLLIYNNFINLISAIDGSFIRQFNFGPNIMLIKRFQQTMYLFSIDKKLYSWKIGQSDPQLEISISTGTINSKSDVIAALNNLSRIFTVSFYEYKKQIILSEINAKQSNEVVLLYSNYVFVQQNFIITQSFENRIEINYIEENQVNKLEVKVITQSLLCESIQGQFNQIQTFQKQLYFLTFMNSKGIRAFSSFNQNCLIFSDDLIPAKIDLYYFKKDQNDQQNIIILASFQQNTFRIFKGQTYEILFKIVLDYSIIDFRATLINDDLTKLYVLKQNQIIDVYNLKYINQIQQKPSFNLIKSISTLINNPLRLITFNQQTESSNEKILCVFSQDIQIINIQEDVTSGITIDFKEKTFQNTNKINSIYLSEVQNLIITCADDGKIVIWNNFDIFNPVFFNSISIKGQRCIKVMLFQQQFVVARFSNSIVLQNIFNKNINKIFNFSSQFSFIYTSINYIYLIFDKQIKIYQGIEQIFNYQIDKDLQNVFITNSEELYFLDSQFLLAAYTVDIPNQKIIFKSSINPYQLKSTVQFIKTYERNNQGKYFKIAINFFINIIKKEYIYTIHKKQFINYFFFVKIETIFMINFDTIYFLVLDINLNPLFPQVEIAGFVMQIYQFDQNQYLFLLNAPNKNKAFPIAMQFYDIRNNSIFIDVMLVLNCLAISNVRKMKGIGKDYYNLDFKVPFGQEVFNAYIVWKQQSNVQLVQSTTYLQNTLTTDIANSSKTINYVGVDKGLLSLTTYNKQITVEKVFSLLNQSDQDKISFIRYSLFFKSYYVVSKYFIYESNLFTNEFIQKVQLQYINQSSENIQNLYLFEKVGIIIAFTSSQVYLYDYQTKSQYYLKTNVAKYSILQDIKGLFFDEVSKEVFIFGSLLVQTDTKFSNFKQISPSQYSNFQDCIFFDKLIVCKHNSIRVSFYSRNQDFSVIQVLELQSPYTSDFKLKFDIDNENIFITQNTIDIYNFSGIFKVNLPQISQSVIQFDVAGTYLIAYTQPIAFIYSRSSLKLITTFYPSGGIFQKGFYFPEVNILAYLTNEIRFGQIKLYNLETLQPIGSVVNTFTSNGVGNVLNLKFDPDSSEINYLDSYGNFQNARYGSQILMAALISLDDKEQADSKDPIDYVLDFSLNDIYYFNAQNVWKINYNYLNKNYQRVFQAEEVNYLLVIKQQISNSNIQQIQVLYNTNNNFIFSFDNGKTVFVKKFDEDILQMKNFKQDNNLVSLIVFSNKIQVFIGQSVDLKSDNSFHEISNISLQKFLLNESNILVFQTVENEIIDYNFVSNKQLYSFQLDKNVFIQSKIHVYDKDNRNINLYFSLSNGSIIKYNTTIKKQKIFSHIKNQDIVIKFIFLNKGVFILLMKSGQLFEVDTEFQLLPQQILSQKVEQITQKNSNADEIKYTFASYDPIGERLFLSVVDLKYVGVYNVLNNYSLISYLYFPDIYWKQIYFTKKEVILGCSFQLNIYSQNLLYIGRHRKSNRLFQITNVIEIYDNILLIIYLTGIETIVVNDELNIIKSINMISLNSPKLIHYQNILDLDLIMIVGISSTGIFNENLSIKYILEQGQLNKQRNLQNTNQNQICYKDIEYINYVKTSNEIDDIYRFQYNHEIQYQFTILIQDEINLINIFNKKNVQIVMRPINLSNKLLRINEHSFQNVPFNIYLTDFNLLLNDKQKRIYFHNNTQNITLQNIEIANQEFKFGTQLVFENKRIIQIQNITISGIKFLNIEANKRNLQTQIEKQAFLQFYNCDYVIIENLVIKNLIQENEFFLFIKSTQQQQFILKNFTIETSIITDNLISFADIANLRIESMVIHGCKQYKETINNLQYNPLINIEGIQQIRIEHLNAEDNIDLTILKLIDSYQDSFKYYILKKSQILIKNSQIVNNKFQLSLNPDSQINLFDIQSYKIYITNLQVINNQANIFIKNSQKIIIFDSIFKENNGVMGGAIQLQSISNLLIESSLFMNNKVSASGGSLSLQDVIDFKISSSCKFTNNFALIGGAIRNTITDIKLQNTLNHFTEKSSFSDNFAEIYGNNIGTYPSKFFIYQSMHEDQTQKELKYQGQLFNSTQDAIILDEVQSGNNTFLSVQLQDEYGKTLEIDQNKIIENKYPLLIMEELQIYLFEIVNQNNNKDFELKGESLITVRQYSSLYKSLLFNNLILGGIPNHLIKTPLYKIKVTNWYPILQIPLNINFRKCQIGEIPVRPSSSITYCQKCSSGSYSIQNPQLIENANETSDQIQCKKCPVGTLSCEGSIIILKQGYWRESSQTDQIIKCNEINSEICDPENQNSKYGCSEGHIGPLCESCDIYGDVWDGVSYYEALGLYSCSKCSDSRIQIVYISLVLILIFFYLCMTIKTFISSFQYNVLCTYFRYMKILPFSKSCIQDESNFIIKSFINYLQLSSILIQTHINIVLDIFSYLPNFFGQPANRISVSLNCFFKDLSQLLKIKDPLQLTCIIYSFIPISLFIFILAFFIILKKVQKTKSYPFSFYLILNIVFFFFQPDVINYLTSSLVCRQIGDKKVARNNLLLDCYDGTLQKFQLYGVLPFLIFWIILPLIILLKFIKDKRKYKNIDYCTMKFKFGYFYLEFKEKYYYWEFIRVFFKISIVLIITLLNQLDLLQYFLSLIIITLYLYIINSLKPFQSIKLGKLEEVSQISLILNIFLSQLFIMYQQQFIGIILMFSQYVMNMVYLKEIIKMKSKSILQKPNKTLRWIIQKVLSKNKYEQIINRSQRKLKILFNWKRIYKNLAFLRGVKVSEYIKKMDETSLINSSQGILKEQVQLIQSKNLFTIENSKKYSQFQKKPFPKLQSFNLGDNESTTLDNLYKEGMSQSPLRQTIFSLLNNKQSKEENQNIKFSDSINTDRSESNIECKETIFPNIYTTDFDEQYSSQQVYFNQKKQKPN